MFQMWFGKFYKKSHIVDILLINVPLMQILWFNIGYYKYIYIQKQVATHQSEYLISQSCDTHPVLLDT